MLPACGLVFVQSRDVLLNTPALRIVLLTIGTCAARMAQELTARPWITPLVMDHPAHLARAFAEVRRMGIARSSVVGGRRVATQLIDAGLVQDVYLTTSPRAGGEPNTPMYPGHLDGRLIVRKRGTGSEAGVVFDHTRCWPTVSEPPRKKQR